jgi:hypothetical protein
LVYLLWRLLVDAYEISFSPHFTNSQASKL